MDVHMCVYLWARFKQGGYLLFHSRCAFFSLHLHVWKTEVKVTETKQTAFLLVARAAAVTFCPGRLGPGPSSADLLHSII